MINYVDACSMIALSGSFLQITRSSISQPDSTGRSEKQTGRRNTGKVGEYEPIEELPSQKGGTEAVSNDEIEDSQNPQATQTVAFRPKKKVGRVGLITDRQTRFASLEPTDNFVANAEIDVDIYANMLDDLSEAQPASPILSFPQARMTEARSIDLTEVTASPTPPMPPARQTQARSKGKRQVPSRKRG